MREANSLPAFCWEGGFAATALRERLAKGAGAGRRIE